MALSADVVRQFADALNTHFTEAQAKLIIYLIDAATDQADTAASAAVAALGIPAFTATQDDTYVLELDSGAVAWVPES